MTTIEVFPGNVLIKMDPISAMINNIWTHIKGEPNKNKGKVIKSGSKIFNPGDHVLFFSSNGIIMDTQCLIYEKEVLLIFKNNKLMEVMGSRVLITPDPAPKKTDAGIILEAVKNPPQTGIVREIGKEVEDFIPGDHVLFEERSGIDISKHLPKGEKGLIIRLQDIIAKI